MRLIGLAVVLAVSCVLAPIAGETQTAGKVPRIGILETGSQSARGGSWPAFHQRLRELGYAEGQSIIFETRSADDRSERLRGLAAELIGLKVDIIVTTGTPAAVAAKQATATIPIVMAIATNPVGAGLTASLGRPGGKVTGLANLDAELSGKRLEMLKAAVPALSRVAILWNPANPAHKPALGDTESTAHALGVRLQPVEARNPSELSDAFSAMRQSAPAVSCC
jgi:ABC-type uncharacterized transport system substrate-binding protein